MTSGQGIKVAHGLRKVCRFFVVNALVLGDLCHDLLILKNLQLFFCHAFQLLCLFFSVFTIIFDLTLAQIPLFVFFPSTYSGSLLARSIEDPRITEVDHAVTEILSILHVSVNARQCTLLNLCKFFNLSDSHFEE